MAIAIMNEIIKLIKVFEKEYDKFSEELDLLGKRLESASSQYTAVSTTRTRKLMTTIEKIKGAEVLPELKAPDEKI